MPINPDLATQVRRLLVKHLPDGVAVSEITEKKMFGGLAFMVRGKLCVGISGRDAVEVMLRIGKAQHDAALEHEGVRTTVMKGREYRGYIDLDETGLAMLEHWITLALTHTLSLTGHATQNITDAQTLYAALSARANPEEAQHMAAYMKNRFSFFGIRKPELNRLLKPFLKATRCRPVDWDFVEACWQAEEREMQYAALLYLQARKSALHAKDLPALHRLITRKSWWDSIDVLDRIVGDIALRHPHLNTTLLDWSTDDNFWLRRIAIDHQLLRKDRTDTALLAQILINNLGQKEFFINKAIGWALRDYSKTHPEWVRQFIAAHRDRMASLSLREAQKYL